MQNLKKTFSSDSGVVRAVDGVSFEISEGQFYTLLGPSGCGKTTTLLCVAGLETPSQGEIIMAGEKVFSDQSNVFVPAHQRDIGMVFQSYAVWPHMTVFENVAFPLMYGRRRLPAAQVRQRVIRALELVQLDKLSTRPAPFLSGGQQQRVALARAIVDEPKLLLLDEPLSNLDAKLRAEMRLEIRQLASKLRITALYVTHDQVEALSMSDRIGVTYDGRIVQEGTPRQIYTTPKDRFVADFLGRSNFLHGQVVEVAQGLGFSLVNTPIGPLRVALTDVQAEVDDTVLLAIRPAGIRVLGNSSRTEENSFEGNLESLVFEGELFECQVQVKDHVLRIVLDPYTDLRPGQKVYLELPADRVIAVGRL